MIDNNVVVSYLLISLPKKLSAQNEFLLKLDDKIGANQQKLDRIEGLTMFSVSFICRPIPQWFRLKTDTKIQVCQGLCLHL